MQMTSAVSLLHVSLFHYYVLQNDGRFIYPYISITMKLIKLFTIMSVSLCLFSLYGMANTLVSMKYETQPESLVEEPLPEYKQVDIVQDAYKRKDELDNSYQKTATVFYISLVLSCAGGIYLYYK